MDNITDILNKLHAIQLDILKVASSICDEFGLTWFAEGGTCLGAVRHKGFIPWDDDIDIALPWEDYQIFCRYAPEILRGSEYGFYSRYCTDGYPPLFAKLYKKGTRFVSRQMQSAGFESGIFIDLFAYDRLDSRQRKAALQAKNLTILRKLSYLQEISDLSVFSLNQLQLLTKIAVTMTRNISRLLYPREKLENTFFHLLDKGDRKGPWVDIFYSSDCRPFKEETLFPVSYLPFENLVIPVPHDTDTYLTALYDDYMKLPSENERYSKMPLILDFGDGVNVFEA